MQSAKKPEVDAYIENSQPFARPILQHLRKLIHQANPNTTESIKWRMPHFEDHGSFCFMAAFKQHVSLGFNKFSLLKDPKGHLQANASGGGDGMGNLGKITSVHDLPPNHILIDFFQQAASLNIAGIKQVKKRLDKPKAVYLPPKFQSALKKDKVADSAFSKMSASCKAEYINWIAEAKTETTQLKRISEALIWISEGKKRNWKYDKKNKTEKTGKETGTIQENISSFSFNNYLTSVNNKIASKRLIELRELLKKMMPDAEEVISYTMPAFKMKKIVVYYAAHKQHIGFYPTSAPIRHFEKELKKYVTSKGAIQFPFDKPLPEKLIRMIITFRKKQIKNKTSD